MEQASESRQELPLVAAETRQRMRWSNVTSAERLVDYCLLGILPNDYEITLDYFRGIARYSNDGRVAYLRRVRLVFAIYSGLVKMYFVDASTLHSAMVEGRLMALIADNYGKCPCKHYVDFCAEYIDLDARAF